jgi:hypothetical protein
MPFLNALSNNKVPSALNARLPFPNAGPQFDGAMTAESEPEDVPLSTSNNSIIPQDLSIATRLPSGDKTALSVSTCG